MDETLQDHLRRATRNFTARLEEDEIFALGCDLARSLVQAHGETPPRHPNLDPEAIPMANGKPCLAGGPSEGTDVEDLFQLGCLLASLAIGKPAAVSWRLDGAPPVEFESVLRRAVLQTLAAPRTIDRYHSAAEAVEALDAAASLEEQGPAPWPLFRGDPARSGFRSAASPASPASLAPAWHAAVGPVIASPVVMATLVVAATVDGRLVFLDRRGGRRAHEIKLATALESSPALGDGALHLGTDDGEMVGVDAVTGDERYRVKLGRLVRSSPLPLPDRILVGVVEERGGSVVAVSPRGKLVWTRRLEAGVFSSPTLAGDRVAVGCDDGAVHALDPASGAIIWSHEVGAKVRSTPAASAGVVYAADFDGRVVALRVADGTRAWARELGHSIYSSPCLVGTLLVVGCHDGHVHGLDAVSGEPRFEVATRGPVVSSPVACGDRILAASTAGDVYVLGMAGEVMARTPAAGGDVQSSPALAEGQAFVGTRTGLQAFRLQS